MAERSLGEAWKTLNAAERRQYVRVFLKLLRDDLTDKLREYSSTQVTYLSETAGEESSQVVTAPAGLNVDTRIEFQVVRRPGGWILDDLVCDGVSIVTNYQTQFSRILREGSFSDLMEHMKQKALIAQLAERIDS
jgi:phospholipid transport system substrate-binding protein